MKYFLILLFAFTLSAFSSDPEIHGKRLAALTYAAVTRTDTYWDGGSIGVSLTADHGQTFEVRTLNPKLSPQQRTLLFSTQSDRRGFTIPVGSELERQLIRLLQTQPQNDPRGVEIAENLLKILKDRETPWENERWYTLEYLKESLQKSLAAKMKPNEEIE